MLQPLRLHHKGWFDTSPLRLPISAGFSVVPTCHQITFEWDWIFCTLLLTNCLYSPGDLIQYNATVPSIQQYFAVKVNPSKASVTFVRRLTAICPDTNSRRGIVKPDFASLARAATSPWLTPDSCTTTAYTAAATPFPLASPKACNSMDWTSSWWTAKDLGTVCCSVPSSASTHLVACRPSYV